MVSAGESSPYDLSPEQAENMLSGLPPEVLSVLEREQALSLAIGAHNLEWSSEAVRAENPYDTPRSGPPELAFIKPDRAARIIEIYETDERPEKVTGRISPHPLRLFKATMTHTRLHNLAADADTACAQQIKSVSDDMRKLQESTSVSTSKSGQKLTAQEANALFDAMQTHRQFAGALPVEADVAAIKSVFDMSGEILRAKLGHIGPIAARNNFEYMEKAKHSSANTEKLIPYLKSTVKLGRAYYKELQTSMEGATVHYALSLLSSAVAAKEQLETVRQGAAEDQLPAILAAEEYVVGQAAAAEKVIRELRPGIFESKAVRREFEQILSRDLTEAEKARRAEYERRISADLSGRVSEARDILRGGGRLPVKNGDKPQELAKSLHSLTIGSSKEKLAETDENGIMISLITGRFDRFRRTLLEVQQSDLANESLEVVERDRSVLVKELRSFNLDTKMARIKSILDDASLSQELRGVMTAEQFTRLELAAEKYYERQENVRAQGPEIDSVLDNEELYARLDWTVLPAGEAELEKTAREIVAMIQERGDRKVEIDLERLNILKNIKEEWGADRCYYARGTLSGRHKVTVEGTEQPDEYIVLVLQSLNSDNGVITEHAVAESPIAGHNAMYITRGDVSEFGWRDIYSLPKKDARAFGARAVKHTKGDGSGLVNVMTGRARHLLSCSPEEFSAIEFNGRYVRLAKQIGAVSTSR